MKMELDDLQYHVDALLNKTEQDKKSDRIINYVYKENSAMLNNEKSCLEQVVNDLDGLNLDDYSDFNVLIEAVEKLIYLIFDQHNLFTADNTLVKRKIEKVKKYVSL